jgi:uncharacterized damage-inducible protein DinB
MFRRLSDFYGDWGYNSGSTQKILDVLTDDSLKQEVTSSNRNLGRIAWHLVTSIQVLMLPTGLTFDSPSQDEPVPATSKEIADTFRQVNKSFIEAVQSKWIDEDLTVLNNIFGQELPNGVTLSILNQHQIHHRGQITVLMRQAGLMVPGIYGPAREEWAKLGLEEPEI